MTPVTWARITDLFEQVLERPQDDRNAFLADLQRRDAGAAAEVASLLEAHERPGEFLPALPNLSEVPELAGRVVGAYRLLRLLGTGGTGAVYLAERNDGTFAKRVAVKLLSAGFLPLRDRFLRERELLARLEHPNIARLLDAGTTADHLLYLVMEYVDGLPIDRVLQPTTGSRWANASHSSSRSAPAWRTRIATSSSTATSSRRTSSSPLMGRSSCWISGLPASSVRRAPSRAIGRPHRPTRARSSSRARPSRRPPTCTRWERSPTWS